MPKPDAKTKEFIEPKEGEIPLFCKGAIGLKPKRDAIRLHRNPAGPPYQLIRGLYFHFTGQGKGCKEGDINNILKATEFRLKMPGSILPYHAKMSGWEIYREPFPGTIIYKPRIFTVTGEDGVDVHFSILDEYSTDPGFPFWQYGGLTETNRPTSSKHRWSIYVLGLNAPLSTAPPGYAPDIPPEAEIFNMLKPGLWKGTYQIEIDIAPFIVEEDFENYNYAAMLVWLGRALYDEGQLTYASGWYVGDATKSWPDGLWEGCGITILSGLAEGKIYSIAKNFKTDNYPPPGLPPNEHLIKVLQTYGHSPAADGVKAGDYYKIQSGYTQVKKYVADKISFEPGTHDAQTLKYIFEVEDPYDE